MKCYLPFLGMLALSFAVHAQDKQDESPALEIKTNSAQLVENMLESFDSDADVPDLAEGSHYGLSLDDGGGLLIKTAVGEAKFLELVARPSGIMELFEDEVQNARQMAQMMGGMGLGKAGIAATDVNTIIEGLFSFPEQVAVLKLTIVEDPEATHGVDASIEIDAVDDSWLGRVLANAHPNQNGVRMLDAGGAMIAAVTNVHFPSLAKHFGAFYEILAGMGMDTDEERKESLAFIEQENGAFDGTSCLVIDPEFHMSSVMGLTDASVMPKLWANKRFIELEQMRSEGADNSTVSLTPKAFSYQDIEVLKRVVEFDNPDQAGPFAEDGKKTDFAAVAANYIVRAGDKATTEALIDEVLDTEVKRKRLTSLFTFTMDLDTFIDVITELSAGQIPALGEDLPASLQVNITKKGKGLIIGVVAK